MADPASQRIWVVDDDRSVRFVLSTALRDAGYSVDGFESAAAALAALRQRPAPDLLFTDVRMPGEDGLVLLDKLKNAHPQLPVIVMSAYTDVASTAGAFRGGAHEFLSKPFDLDDAVALAARALPDENLVMATPTAPPGSSELIGDTPAMRALFRAIGRLAQAPLSVLVNGETGTGKELVARALHHESPRARAPFVALNTAAIPAELLESELFGHEAGAFTGASKRHIGRFEQANGGTLFLDEIGDMPMPLQTRLLRVLAENEFFRVGGRELIRVDVRVIAATHQDLEALVEQGRFRADLLHRLDVVRLQLPPLRERSDKTELIRTLLACEGGPDACLSPEAERALMAYAWPGNIRQLRHVLRTAAALADGRPIACTHLPAAALSLQPASHGTEGSASSLRAEALPGGHAGASAARDSHADNAGSKLNLIQANERELLLKLLEQHRWNVSNVAKALDVSRNTLYRKIHKLQIEVSHPEQGA